MAWGRLDDRFCIHPKVLAASFESMGLYAMSISYASLYETDGVVTAEAAAMLCKGRTELVDELVRRCFWDRTETGYIIHGYLEYNLSRAQLAKQRKATRKRVARHRSGNAVTNALVTRPSERVTQGRVGKGREGSSSSLSSSSSGGNGVQRKRGPWHTVPEGETLTDARRVIAVKAGVLPHDIESTWEDFTDCEFKTPHTDVDKTWRRWCKEAVRRRGPASRTTGYNPKTAGNVAAGLAFLKGKP